MNKTKNILFYDLKYILKENFHLCVFVMASFIALLISISYRESVKYAIQQNLSKHDTVEVGYRVIQKENELEILIPYTVDSDIYFKNNNGDILNIDRIKLDSSISVQNNEQGKMLTFKKMAHKPKDPTIIYLTNGKRINVKWIDKIPTLIETNGTITHYTKEIIFSDKKAMIKSDHFLNVNQVTNQKINNDKAILQYNLVNMLDMYNSFILLSVFVLSFSLSSIILKLIIQRYFYYLNRRYGLNKAEFEFLSIISNLSLEQRKKLLYKTFDPKNIDEHFDEYNIQLKRYFQLYHNKSKLYQNIKRTNDFNMLINHINKFKDLLHFIVNDWKILMEQKGEFELICKELDKTINIDKIKQVEFNYQSMIEENKVNFFDITKHNFSKNELQFFSYSRNIKLDMIFFLKGKSPAIYFNLDKYVEQNGKIIEQMKRIYFDELTE